MRTTVYQDNLKGQFHATVSNDKLGGHEYKLMAVSYVPGNEIITYKNGKPVSDCIGTCGSVDCSGCARVGQCYAIRSYMQYPAVTINRIENTKQLREDINKHFDEIREYIRVNEIKMVRWQESGEIETFEQGDKELETADMFPDVTFYLYTKNYDWLRHVFASRELPKNTTVLVSVWEGIGLSEYNEFKNHENVKAFVVNTPELIPDVMCPAYAEVVKHYKSGDKVKVVMTTEKNGFSPEYVKAVKCGNCQQCTRNRTSKVIGCLKH